MKRVVFSAFLVCSLGLACGSKHNDPGNQPANMAGTGAGPSAGSSGAAGQAGGQSGGGEASDDGGGVNGGVAGTVDGGAAGGAIGGASGHAGTSSGGAANAGAGGQIAWPNWVDQCLSAQAEKSCGHCTTRDCLVCIYGTDAELASTKVNCNDTVRNYKDYCKCSGCVRDCRPEYQ